MKKAQRGQPLIIPANTYNAFIDAAHDFQRRKLSQQNTGLSTSREAVVLFALALTRRLAELRDGVPTPNPSTPSGMVPVYTKPNKSKRHGKPGARDGHAGARRATPVRIDERKTHRLTCCPDCGGRPLRCQRSRTRIIEDVPEAITPVVTEHTLHRDYCPKCKKDVEPVVPDAMPKAQLGHRFISLTAWFHYGLGLTIDQIVSVLRHHLQTELTSGGLDDQGHVRLRPLEHRRRPRPGLDQRDGRAGSMRELMEMRHAHRRQGQVVQGWQAQPADHRQGAGLYHQRPLFRMLHAVRPGFVRHEQQQPDVEPDAVSGAPGVATPCAFWRLIETGVCYLYSYPWYGAGCVDSTGRLVGLPSSFTSQYSYNGYMQLQIGCRSASGTQINWPGSCQSTSRVYSCGGGAAGGGGSGGGGDGDIDPELPAPGPVAK